MHFVSIRAGKFMMGCSVDDPECNADEKPAHQVSITRSFEVGKYQVTQAEYEAVMAANPSNSKGANLPVEGVSWEDAQKFCEAINRKGDGYRYRLPTEAEWEYAATGRWRTLPGRATIPAAKAIPSARKSPTRLDCMTRWATSGSGCKTGIR
jgi:formylglycine-generating enzyme required for sulfatase activity